MSGVPERLSLTSGRVTVELIPAWGAKLVSLRTEPDGYEFMCQPPFGPHTPSPEVYSAEDAYGFDEIFPGMLPEPYPVEPYRHVPVFDHGNLWFSRWEHRGGSELELWIEDEALGYRFGKRLWFAGANTLVTRYTIENRGVDALHWLYAAHILLPFHDGVELELPRSDYTRLELFGEGLPERARADEPALTRGSHFPRGTAGLFISNELTARSCAYSDVLAGKRLDLTWTPPLAFLGMWYNRGGWTEARPVTHIGVEPCTSRFSSLAECVAAGESNPLLPGESVAWEITMECGP